MKIKHVIPRALAVTDIDRALEHYLTESSAQVALGFVQALERAFAHIERHPASGSTRYAHELNLPGLRCWQINRYPQLVFYFEAHDHIDVWRVLNGRQDIPTWLLE